MIASARYPSHCSQLETPLAISLDNSVSLQDQRIRQAQNGNLEAFNELVLTYHDCVFRQALWLLNDEAAAEDAAQEAFFRAFQKIHTFVGPSFRTWIIRITTNYCLDQLRRRKPHPIVPLETCCKNTGEADENSRWLTDPQPSPEQVVERSELSEGIRQCLLELSPNFRLPIILVDIQEMEYREAAQVMGMRLGSFKSRLSRGRARLLQATLRLPNADLLFSKAYAAATAMNC
jgi:RNA polymerase sigma-70 factor, ECF subfamily